MQAQSGIAVRVAQLHPALIPLAKLSPTKLEKTLSLTSAWLEGHRKKLVFFEKVATRYIIAFLLESEVIGLYLLEQMLYGINSCINCLPRINQCDHPYRQVGKLWFTDLDSLLHSAHWGSKNCKKIKMLVHKKYLTGTGIETISTNACVWAQTSASPEYLPCDFY